MKQEQKGYSILIIEDNPGDQILLGENLKDTNLKIDEIISVDTIAEAKKMVELQHFSIIFLDLFLPDSSGLDTFSQLAKVISKTPVIISSGLSDTQVALRAISMGAQDFLIKGEYSVALLEKAVRYGIERKEAEQLVKTSEEKYRYLFDNNPATIFIWSLVDFRILQVNETALQLYGYTKEEFLQKTLLDIRPDTDHKQLAIVAAKLRHDSARTSGIWKHVNKKGEMIYLDISSHNIVYQGQRAVLSLANNITERVLLQEKLEEEKTKKQQEIAAAVIIAQAQERTFLGEELHDNINQILATASLYMDCALSDEESRIMRITESKEFIKNAMEEIRKLSKTLLPPSLGNANLLEAVQDTIDNIKKVNEHVHFITDFRVPSENSLGDKLKLAVYRIIQEQLNNIFKHAKASTIMISIKLQAGMLQLQIKDDGVGFDTSKKADGIGLQNIFERTALLKGTAKIVSKPGEGCELLVNFDIETAWEKEAVLADHPRNVHA
ncbi:MAG: PAS domain S-box protein [Ferruginibacter sp.]